VEGEEEEGGEREEGRGEVVEVLRSRINLMRAERLSEDENLQP
jgi:hypothetical protein